MRSSRTFRFVVALAVSAVVIPTGSVASADEPSTTASETAPVTAGEGTPTSDGTSAQLPDVPAATSTSADLAEPPAVADPSQPSSRATPEGTTPTASPLPETSTGAAATTGTSLPVGNWEISEALGEHVSVAGWALDPDQPAVAVEVRVYVDGVGFTTTAHASRPDVGAAFPGAGAGHGFIWSRSVSPGQHTVCVSAIDVDTPSTNTSFGCRTIATQFALPQANWDTQVSRDGVLTVGGWAFDPDHAWATSEVHVYVNGRGNRLSAGGHRPDVGAAFPDAGPTHGWQLPLVLGAGRTTVCAYAIDLDLSWRNTSLGCRDFVVAAPPGPTTPVGNWEIARSEYGGLTLAGWAFDPNSPDGAVEVHLYVDGQNFVVRTGDVARPDVVGAFASAGPNTGWQLRTSISSGPHQVCAYAIDRERPWTNTPFGCRTVTRTNSLPTAQWDAMDLDGTLLTVEGWAFDVDQHSYYDVPVHIYVDGRFQQVWQYVERPDVGAAYPGVGDWTGWTYSINVDTGPHRVCIYAIDDAQPWLNTALGCRTVTSTATRPIGSWDFDGPVSAGPVLAGSIPMGSVPVAGWAFDPGDPTEVLDVVVTVEWGQTGLDEHVVTADVHRPDVAAVHPQAGPDHGFTLSVPLHQGPNMVCVDLVGLYETRTLQCRQANVR